jgi:hypothetical protein
MALDSDELKNLLDAKARLYMGVEYATMGAGAKEKLFRVIAEAVVEHIVQRAQVKVDSVTGVVTGNSLSGPGTGTIS